MSRDLLREYEDYVARCKASGIAFAAYSCPDCGAEIETRMPDQDEVWNTGVRCPWCGSNHYMVLRAGLRPQIHQLHSHLQLSPLAKLIHADVARREVVDAEDLRERLTVASRSRFQAACRELRRARLIAEAGTNLRRRGSSAPTPPSDIHQVARMRSKVRRAAASGAAA